MTYSLSITKHAAAELAALPNDICSRLDRAILGLADNPRPPGCRKLKGNVLQGYRIRVGDYRILYVVDDPGHAVRIYRVGHRRDVYGA